MHPDTGNLTTDAGMELALRWLAVRGRSRAQIEARLRRAGASEETAEGVTTRLAELGILNDRAFALASTETGLRKGLAKGYFQGELEGKGVARDDVAWALEETGNFDPDAARAFRLAEGWARAHPSETGLRGLRRLGNLLMRKGYDEELTADVCRRVLGDPPAAEGGND